jgi:hypothetical protein
MVFLSWPNSLEDSSILGRQSRQGVPQSKAPSKLLLREQRSHVTGSHHITHGYHLIDAICALSSDIHTLPQRLDVYHHRSHIATHAFSLLLAAISSCASRTKKLPRC